MTKPIQLLWEETVNKAGWSVPGENKSYLWSKWRLHRLWLPRDLQNGRVQRGFKNLIQGTGFLEWWQLKCGGEGDKVFVMRFSDADGAWSIPWELLIERVKEADKTKVESICLVRTADDTLLATRRFDWPLKILILKGAYDGPGLDRLDLDREIQQIQLAWQNLEQGVRECVEAPLIMEARRGTLSDLLRDLKPHLLWFSGHGRVRLEAELLFMGGEDEWVSSSELAKLLKASGQKLLYAVFWACDTGGSGRKRKGVAYPPSLYEKLRNVGVLSLLTMQSPIGDGSALAMTQHFFRNLAVGLPLEKAVARARAHLMHGPQPEDALPLDWATPVTWSAGMPVERFEWNARAQSIAQFQVLGRYALDWAQTIPQYLDAEITVEEQNRANIWASYPRIWISDDVRSGERRVSWLRRLRVMQSQSQWTVIAVEINPDVHETGEALQGWAESIYSRLLPGEFPPEIVQAFEMMGRQNNPAIERGWARLCSFDRIYLAIANPPPYRDLQDWFWRPLLERTDDQPVAILSSQEITGEIHENWRLDRMDTPRHSAELEAAFHQAPRLARALAVLNMPLWKRYLHVNAGADEGASSLEEWLAGANMVLDTASGPVMTASAQQYVLSMSTSDQLLKEAHLDCVYMLGQRGLNLTSPIREHRLDHLLGAGLGELAILEASALCRHYLDAKRPFAVRRVFDRMGDLKGYLPAEVLVIVAWAYLCLGHIDHARWWLERADPKEPLDRAWKHGLQAEMYKNEGMENSKENALTEIEKAIDICKREAVRIGGKAKGEDFVRVQRRTLAYRQDWARIKQYLFYRLQEAADEYQRLEVDWSALPEPGLDLAVVMRNHADCLGSLAKGSGNMFWDRADDLLLEAEAIARDFPNAMVLSEILYEKARRAERENRWTEASKYLDGCKEEATRSQHFMMKAIAENRRFWNRILHDGVAFSLEEWRRCEEALENYPGHGWAVRALINSRLRAARTLELDGDLQEAFALLKTNLADIERTPSYTEGSDRLRIARTMAGLQVIGKKMGQSLSYWQDFLEKYRWFGEMRGPEVVWQEVI
jgi:hypothetical protein